MENVRREKNLTVLRNCNRALVVFFLVALTAGSTVHVYATNPSQPILTAVHAFVGDPLFDLIGDSGALLTSKLPDDRTAMASTTKIVTLHVAVDALMGRFASRSCGPTHYCQLEDIVTIGPNAIVMGPDFVSQSTDWVPCPGQAVGLVGPSGCSSLMFDAQGEPLVDDANLNNVFDARDQVIWPLSQIKPLTPGTPLATDPKVKYVESDGDNIWNPGEWIVMDANSTALGGVSNGVYDKGERVFLAPPNTTPAPGTPLNFDPRLKYVESGWDPQDWNSFRSLQIGEKVKFADLLRGMMYPSGNDAAIAVAEHVAGDVESFVKLMNDVAKELGLSENTHFTNPAGLDDWCPTFILDPDTGGTPEFCQGQYRKPVLNIGTSRHYTTARDLARIWVHAMKDDLFRQIVGFQGTYRFCTSLSGPGDNPSCAGIGQGDKFYSFGFGGQYPGWEGAKGGGSLGCGVCEIVSARRIGRELVAAMMQSTVQSITSDRTSLFDYGFASLFHPDKRGVALDGFLVDDALVVLPFNRVVVAGITSTFAEKLSTWKVDVDNSQVTKLAENSAGPATPASIFPQTLRIQAIGLGINNIAVAKTVATQFLLSGGLSNPGTVTLSLWNIAPDGTPSQFVHDVPAGTGSGVRLLPISDTMFVSAFVGNDHTLVLKSWAKVVHNSLESKTTTTTIKNLASLNPSTPIDEVDIARLGAYSLVTAVRRSSDGNIVNQVWSVDPNTGEIASLGSVDLAVQGDSLSIIRIPVESFPFEGPPPAYFATAFRLTDGNLGIILSKIGLDVSGGISEAGPAQNTGYQIIGRPSLAPLGSSGMIITMRDSDSRQKLIVWEIRRNPTNDLFAPLQYRVANHTETDVAIKAVTMSGLSTTHAEGDFVSGTLTEGGFGGGGLLQVWAWRVGDRPY